jgi:CheY-like chemotaxis protein
MSKTLRVLLAEDTRAYLERILTLLDSLDLVISVAEDGEQAIEYITNLSEPLDLLVTDMDMPKRTGWHVIEALRVHRGHSIPVIMQTGEAQYEWVQAKAAEMEIELIDKIHVDTRLVDAVRRALQLP